VDQLDPVGETPEFADHLARSHLLRFYVDGRPAFLVTNTLVENLPDQSAQAVGDCADRLGVSESGNSRRYTIAKIVPLAFTAAFAA
jgi:hypothetical protein